jgi:cyclopropane fatty-acyl-phospholipid synthase-like methyltransferase
MTDDATSAFYDQNAEVYANRNRSLPQSWLEGFLSELAPGGSILELGCGGGQDCAYMLSKGFRVTPTDGSPELAKQAERLLGQPVRVMRFHELDADGEFDGIWAHASLLHVPRRQLPDIFDRIRYALREKGRFHASFKAGDAEGHDSFGRYYNYPSGEWLSDILTEGGWRNISMTETNGSGYDGKPTRWIYVKAAK